MCMSAHSEDRSRKLHSSKARKNLLNPSLETSSASLVRACRTILRYSDLYHFGSFDSVDGFDEFESEIVCGSLEDLRSTSGNTTEKLRMCR